MILPEIKIKQMLESSKTSLRSKDSPRNKAIYNHGTVGNTLHCVTKQFCSLKNEADYTEAQLTLKSHYKQKVLVLKLSFSGFHGIHICAQL